VERLERYREVREVFWMLFAILCCLVLVIAAGAVLGLVYDRIQWR